MWPENWASFQLLVDNRTQWRGAGMAIFGLDYTVFHHQLDRMNLSTEEYDVVMGDIRTMEHAALLAMKDTQ